jgi:hypothetical protein
VFDPKDIVKEVSVGAAQADRRQINLHQQILVSLVKGLATYFQKSCVYI